jgi:hypothetical protein
MGAAGLMCLSSVVAATTPGTALAAQKIQVTSTKLTGYTVTEGDISVPAHGQATATALCPAGDDVVGGGGYQKSQGMNETLASSMPTSGGSGWAVSFDNDRGAANSGVAVAVCALGSSLSNYSVQFGSMVSVPPGGEAEAVVTCPTGTVSLGGGGENAGGDAADVLNASAPYGTNGWRIYIGSTNSDGTAGVAGTVCATEPSGWAQVSHAYVTNPAGKATTVTVSCPGGTNVLGGGPFNSSTASTVTVGLTTSVTGLKAWHSKEDNASSASESVDEWAVCAKAAAAS